MIGAKTPTEEAATILHINAKAHKPISRFKLRLYMRRHCGPGDWDVEIDDAIELVRGVLLDTSRFNLLRWYDDQYPKPETL